MMNFNCLMDRILCQIFKIISNTSLKKHGEYTNKPSVQIYVNKIENRITFKIKDGSSLTFLTPETMKLLGSTESKIAEDKKGENVPHLEITEVVLVHCNIVNNDYQQDSRVLCTFVPNKPFGNDIKFNATMLRSNICDYADAYILVKGTITTTGAGDDATAKRLDERNNGVIFKICAPVTKCISRTSNTEIDNPKDINIAMQMFNLIEYSDNYSKTSRSLWKYYKMIQMIT